MGVGASVYDFERLFELSPDLLCIAGFDGRFRKVNSAVNRTLGYSSEELYASHINDFIHPDDLQKTSKVRKMLTDNHSLVNFENRYITKTGEIVWLSWTAKAAEEGDIIFAIAKNITSKKREEHERISHLANLSERNQNFQKLTYTSSHDLRAPIDNILSIIQLMDLKELGDRNGQLVGLLGRATDQLKAKLDNYIDDLGKSHLVKVKIESVDFEKCLNEVLGSIGHLIEASGAIIEVDFTEAQGVLFNREYLESMLLNLISNAIKYARPTVRPEISIRSKMEDGQVLISVQDNGLGFDLDRVEDKIFGLHQTFHGNPDSKGIGLHLVYTHISSLGGAISVESEVNKGTKFIIAFSDSLVESL